MPLHDVLRTDASALAPELTDLRHRLHRRPEIGLDLPRTQETLLAELDGLGLELSVGRELTSIAGVLRGGRRSSGGARGAGGSASADATVLLRGDMDALPVTEASGEEFSSEIDGAMHACGHDLHMAMLVGAARLLSAHRDELRGDVVFMFQPGEEGWDGAGRMLEAGILDAAGPRVDAAYGMHVMSSKYPRAVFATRPGTLMAASGWLDVTVRGTGGHGSTPHLARDPISAAAEMVTGLQTMVTRRFDVFDPVVVTVGSIRGGTKRNIIPDDAHFDATVRTFSAASQDRIREQAPLLCRRIAEAYGLEAEVTFHDEYPVTERPRARRVRERRRPRGVRRGDVRADGLPAGRFRGLLAGVGEGPRLLPVPGRQPQRRRDHGTEQPQPPCGVRRQRASAGSTAPRRVGGARPRAGRRRAADRRDGLGVSTDLSGGVRTLLHGGRVFDGSAGPHARPPHTTPTPADGPLRNVGGVAWATSPAAPNAESGLSSPPRGWTWPRTGTGLREPRRPGMASSIRARSSVVRSRSIADAAARNDPGRPPTTWVWARTPWRCRDLVPDR